MHEAIILLYLDHLATLSPKPSEITCAKEKLERLFKFTVLSDQNFYLGFSSKSIQNSTLLSQAAYCSPVLKQFGMELTRMTSTPIVENIKEYFLKLFSSGAEQKEAKQTPFRSLIRHLLYLSTHRPPYIMSLVGIYRRVAKSPTTGHCMTAERLLRYLQGTQETSITIGHVSARTRMQNCSLKTLSAYSDSAWATNIATRKFKGGYMNQ